MIKFGKSSDELLDIKRSFFVSNDELVNETKRIGQVYASQPSRSNCKNCDYYLDSDISFYKLEIPYVFCSRCGHLNGAYKDTEEFCKQVYVSKGGKNYSKLYTEKSIKAYFKHVNKIYIPKAEFLIEALNSLNMHPENLRYVDFGAGSGYFLAALKTMGLSNSIGFEVSEEQIAFGNKINRWKAEEILKHHKLEETENIVAGINADILSMIGVLEHVQNPRTILLNLNRNENIKYIFISLPLFSPTVFFEIVFPSVFNRHLSSGHTHLYTESSIDYMCKEFEFKRVAEWYFGTDMVDLFRYLIVRMKQIPVTECLINKWKDLFIDLIDPLQLEIDKKKLSSEVHLLLKKQKT